MAITISSKYFFRLMDILKIKYIYKVDTIVNLYHIELFFNHKDVYEGWVEDNWLQPFYASGKDNEKEVLSGALKYILSNGSPYMDALAILKENDSDKDS